jgi:hypothetical protein
MDEQQGENLEEEETETEAENVDLNRVFREAERDLNSMFPDGEMRKFRMVRCENSSGSLRRIEAATNVS